MQLTLIGPFRKKIARDTVSNKGDMRSYEEGEWERLGYGERKLSGTNLTIKNICTTYNNKIFLLPTGIYQYRYRFNFYTNRFESLCPEQDHVK
jgi:hypothetical protein